MIASFFLALLGRLFLAESTVDTCTKHAGLLYLVKYSFTAYVKSRKFEDSMLYNHPLTTPRMLLFQQTHLRIVVPSANLNKHDWGETGVMENVSRSEPYFQSS